jgi:hypothetical protein
MPLHKFPLPIPQEEEEAPSYDKLYKTTNHGVWNCGFHCITPV